MSVLNTVALHFSPHFMGAVSTQKSGAHTSNDLRTLMRCIITEGRLNNMIYVLSKHGGGELLLAVRLFNMVYFVKQFNRGETDLFG